jgi:hypothetical protein
MINQEGAELSIDHAIVENTDLDLKEQELSNLTETLESQQDIEKQNEEQIKNVLTSLLEEESVFDKSLEGSNLLELTLLMEVIANHENIKLNATRVGILKRTFDEKYQRELLILKKDHDSDPENIKKHKQIIETYSQRFTVALAKFNKRRNEYEKELEAKKIQNTQRKKELLEKLIQIVQEDRYEAIDEVRAIQAEWSQIGHIIDDHENLQSKYKAYLSSFYDRRALFKELLEQDYQTHLKEKLALIDNILALIPSDEQLKEKDGTFWKDASEKIKIYQEEWKTIGNIPLDQKEIINNKFKDAIDLFYNQRKKYYEILDTQRLINAKLKLNLLENIKPFAEFDSQDLNEWRKKTEELKEYQAKWKAIGPAPTNEDTQLWNTFRQYINAFYERKSNFFSKLDKEREAILQQKIQLCEKAEEIAKTDNFKNGFELLKELQKKWKEIDYLTHADYYKVSRRFRKAINAFFKKRNEFYIKQKKLEKENLEQKKAIINRIIELTNEENLSTVLDEVKELQQKWKEIGIIPYKSKETINKEYQTACDNFYKKLKSQPKNYSTKNKSSSFKDYKSSTNKNQGENQKSFDDIKKIRNKITKLEEEIEQYENNILFFAKGKAADKIKLEYIAKIEAAKAQKKELEEKLKSLFEKKVNPSNVENPSVNKEKSYDQDK